VSGSTQGPRAYVRLTEAAFHDLRTLNRHDPQIVRWAFKKMLLLERDPHAGAPLLGQLIGYRKLTVGDRNWRIVWRVITDVENRLVIEIAEVWAVGARSHEEVYAEMRARLDAASGAPGIVKLNEAVALLAKAAWGIEPATEPPGAALPVWLVQRLTTQAGIPAHSVARLTLEQAVDAWTAFTAQPRG